MVEPRHSFRYEVALITLGLLAYALASGVTTQVNPPTKKPPTRASKQTSKNEEANPLALQRRTVAISLLTRWRKRPAASRINRCVRAFRCARGCVVGIRRRKSASPVFGARGKRCHC